MTTIDPAEPQTVDPTSWQLALRVATMPRDTNAFGDIFGGWLMSQADLAGGVIAIKAAGGRVATVAVKDFQFSAPVLVGDLVEVYGRLTRVGQTSLTVEMQVWVQRARGLLERLQVASAIVVYVAVDGEGRPRPVHLD